MSQNRALMILTTGLMIVVMPCCKKEDGSSQGNRGVLQPPPINDDNGASDDDQDGVAAGDPAQSYSGPEFTIDLLVMESYPDQYAALFKVTTNTGGWNLTLDRTEWSDGDVLKAYLTLEGPGPDELVTQALEDHEARYAAGTRDIDKAEAWVRITTRGDPIEKSYLLATTN